MKSWTIVYSDELKKEEWAGFTPYMDIINLWVSNAKALPQLDRYTDWAQQIFPSKPIVLGCYLRDFPSGH